MHHRILTLGFSHIQTTILLGSINILSIVMVLMFSYMGNSVLILMISGVSLLFNWGLTFVIRSKEREKVALRNLFA